ncbi:flagellin [Eubacterium oxidoreducens]|uniref:Flagellin n=1 Tax=Eubacterium oxidoreducens TaxID=1732 RepID=A0A1G6CIS0_EUBOX|nr:flagellin [Eubacterium oxidoreducens]SDB32685.1 flagellin [Eubacterium oxidoreducens]
MQINHNMSAVTANNHLKRTEDAVTASIERLSSGLRINHASDDAAGIAISNKMHAQIKALDQASRNASDGTSVIETADGALNEVTSMIQRMRELAVQAANDTNTTTDLEAIQVEITALKAEIDRVSTDTEFNTMTLLDGTLERRTYSSDSSVVSNITVADDVQVGTYQIVVNDVTTDGTTDASITLGAGFSDTAEWTASGNYITITDENGFEMSMTVKKAGSTATLEVTDLGQMTLQIGANEGQDVDVSIPRIDTQSLHIDEIDVTIEEGAGEAIALLDEALAKVSATRSKLGAYENRLDYSVSSLDAFEENMESAVSRIEDVDMAEEMSEYTKQNVLSQAATSVLSQANEIPQQVLQLLQ